MSVVVNMIHTEHVAVVIGYIHRIRGEHHRWALADAQRCGAIEQLQNICQQVYRWCDVRPHSGFCIAKGTGYGFNVVDSRRGHTAKTTNVIAVFIARFFRCLRRFSFELQKNIAGIPRPVHTGRRIQNAGALADIHSIAQTVDANRKGNAGIITSGNIGQCNSLRCTFAFLDKKIAAVLRNDVLFIVGIGKDNIADVIVEQFHIKGFARCICVVLLPAELEIPAAYNIVEFNDEYPFFAGGKLRYRIVFGEGRVWL